MAETEHHLLITGTGRAGTSFLVKYLAELGLDTHLEDPDGASWDEAAHAGLEDLLLLEQPKHLPYVIKSPWLTEYIDQVLARDDIAIDGVVIPVRNLVEAATSRAVVEMQQRYAGVPGMAQLERSWESWGVTAGGIIFSLNPIDQARLLAVGFHRLVRILTEADIPTIFVTFPRIIEDADYLFAKVQPLLPLGTSLEQAREAHRCVAKADHVRIGTELKGGVAADEFRFTAGGIKYPDQAQVDSVALRREIQRLQRESEEQKSLIRGLTQERETAFEQLRELKVRWRNDVDGQRLKARRAKASVRRIKRSPSWRLTGLLRSASGWLRANRRTKQSG